MPISTFPRHDYDEDEYLLKPAGLRDTHSEGKVIEPLRASEIDWNALAWGAGGPYVTLRPRWYPNLSSASNAMTAFL